MPCCDFPPDYLPPGGRKGDPPSVDVRKATWVADKVSNHRVICVCHLCAAWCESCGAGRVGRGPATLGHQPEDSPTQGGGGHQPGSGSTSKKGICWATPSAADIDMNVISSCSWLAPSARPALPCSPRITITITPPWPAAGHCCNPPADVRPGLDGDVGRCNSLPPPQNSCPAPHPRCPAAAGPLLALARARSQVLMRRSPKASFVFAQSLNMRAEAITPGELESYFAAPGYREPEALQARQAGERGGCRLSRVHDPSASARH